MKPWCWLLTAALILSACRKNPQLTQAAKPVQPPAQIAAHSKAATAMGVGAAAPFGLTITLTGLMGVLQEDGGPLWALLAKADAAVDPTNPQTLPPGILTEPHGPGVLDYRTVLPLHHAWIRFVDAIVTGNGGGTKGRPIAGDLTFETGVAGPPSCDLSAASSSDLIGPFLSPSKRNDKDAVAKLDLVDGAMLHGSTLDPHLVARVRIDAGTAIAVADPCKTGDTYAYKTGHDDGCPAAPPPIKLAEEVVVSQKAITRGSILVHIGGETIELKPLPGKTQVTIQILNDVQQAIDSPVLCTTPMPAHPLPFRWLYWLAPMPQQADTAHHYYPCIGGPGKLRPPVCPLKRLRVAPAGAR